MDSVIYTYKSDECHRSTNGGRKPQEISEMRKVTNPITGQVVDVTETQDKAAYSWAVNEQGYTGTYQEWQVMSDDERNEYELGAAGISA